MQDRHITLVIPGLLDVLQQANDPQITPPTGLAALELLLSRGLQQKVEGDDITSLAFTLFDCPVAENGDRPEAAISYCFDAEEANKGQNGEKHEGYCLRADPVCLQADRDNIVMLGGQGLHLEQAEVDQLVDEINVLLASDDACEGTGDDTCDDTGSRMRLVAPTLDRWYLLLDQDPEIETSPLVDVIGQQIHPHMPRGSNGQQWRALMNELQMLLFASEVNQARLVAGKLPINSLWFWGSGRFPDGKTLQSQTKWGKVWSDNVLFSGFARLAHIPRHQANDSLDWLAEIKAPGQFLIVLEGAHVCYRQQDYSGWGVCIEKLNHQWIIPLIDSLKSKDIDSITLYACHGTSYHLTRKSLKRWWKRPSEFSTYLKIRK